MGTGMAISADVPNPRGTKRSLFGVLCIALPVALHAANWTVTPRINVKETYTDNVSLSPSTLKKDAFITELTPGVTVRGEGRHLDLFLDFRYQKLIYAGDRDRDSENQQLQFEANTEVLPQIVFFDARSTISRQTVNSSGTLSTEAGSTTGNTTTVKTYELSPFIKHHFGAYADGEFRVSANRESMDTGQESDALEFSTDFAGGRRFANLPWTFRSSREFVDNKGGASDFDLLDVDGEIRPVINRRWSVLAGINYKDNDFGATSKKESGFSGRLGGVWHPSARTEVEAGINRQFFGTGPFISLSHRSRRAIWTASYDEQFTTSRATRMTRELIPLTDPFGIPVVDPGTGAQITIPVDTPSLTDEVIVTKSFSGSMFYRGRRTDAGVNLFYTKRAFQQTDNDEDLMGFSVSLDRRLSRRTNANLAASWQQSERLGGSSKDRFWNTTASLSHQITPDLTASLNYRHARQSSTDGGSQYRENAVSMLIGMEF